MRRIREAHRVGESGKRSSRLAREQQKDVGAAGERRRESPQLRSGEEEGKKTLLKIVMRYIYNVITDF